MRGWKTVQNKNKIKKRTRLALIFLGLILLLVILGNLVKLTQTLNSPWKLSAASVKNYTWNGEFNLNLVVKKDAAISVLVFNPKEEKAILINIPDQTQVEVPSGFGIWQIRSVYPLGESDKGRGVRLLKDTVASFLGMPIDGFLDIGGLDSIADAEQLITDFGKKIGGFMLIPKIKTDLTLWELIRLKLSLSAVRFDKIEKLDLSPGLTKSNLADGTPVFTPDLIRVDGIIAPYVADPTIKLEHQNIAIFNGTGVLGIAQKGGRMVTNMGGNAIIISNASKKISQTKLLGDKSQTLKRLTQVFEKCGNSCDRINPTDDKVGSRAQINIILGEDFIIK